MPVFKWVSQVLLDSKSQQAVISFVMHPAVETILCPAVERYIACHMTVLCKCSYTNSKPKRSHTSECP